MIVFFYLFFFLESANSTIMVNEQNKMRRHCITNQKHNVQVTVISVIARSVDIGCFVHKSFVDIQ